MRVGQHEMLAVRGHLPATIQAAQERAHHRAINRGNTVLIQLPGVGPDDLHEMIPAIH